MPLDDPKIREALDETQETALPRMSFGDHLEELRTRVVRSLLAIVVAVVALLPFHDGVQTIIVQPYKIQWRHNFIEHCATLEREVAAALAAGVQPHKQTLAFNDYCRANKDEILAGTLPRTLNIQNETGFHLPYNLYATGGLEDIMAFMLASLVFALVLASPVVIWQIWAFIGAGLYPKERAMFYRFFPFMVLLMVGGVLFGYFVALPYSLGFLTRLMNPELVGAMFSVGQFLTLVFGLTGALGLVFQLPLVMLALQKIGLVTHMGFVRNWRMTILIIFIVAAVVTPPEPVSMLLMATPMLLLYGLGLVLTRFGRHRDAPVVAVS